MHCVFEVVAHAYHVIQLQISWNFIVWPIGVYMQVVTTTVHNGRMISSVAVHIKPEQRDEPKIEYFEEIPGRFIHL